MSDSSPIRCNNVASLKTWRSNVIDWQGHWKSGEKQFPPITSVCNRKKWHRYPRNVVCLWTSTLEMFWPWHRVICLYCVFDWGHYNGHLHREWQLASRQNPVAEVCWVTDLNLSSSFQSCGEWAQRLGKKSQLKKSKNCTIQFLLTFSIVENANRNRWIRQPCV